MSPGAVFFQRNPWFISRWLPESAGSSTHSQENSQSQCLLPQQGYEPQGWHEPLRFQKLAVCFRLNAWLCGRKEKDLWAMLLTMVGICVAETLWYCRTTSTRHSRMGVTTFEMVFLSFRGTQFVLARQQQACWCCYQVTDIVGCRRDHFLICSTSWGRKSGAEVWDSFFTLPWIVSAACWPLK